MIEVLKDLVIFGTFTTVMAGETKMEDSVRSWLTIAGRTNATETLAIAAPRLPVSLRRTHPTMVLLLEIVGTIVPNRFG
jgi:hypothetical protein